MNEKTYLILEYQKIKEKLKEFTLSDLGKKMVDKLYPYTDLAAIENILNITSEAKSIIEKSPSIPLVGLHDISHSLEKVDAGGVLQPEDLVKVSAFLRGCSKMKKYMKNYEYIAPILSSYRNSITALDEIENEIESSIEGNRVSDRASGTLSKIRKKVEAMEAKIEQKLQSILTSSKNKMYIQDFYISKRNDRFVIPVKSSYKNFIEGNVVGTSTTGSTVFIEPHATNKLTNELKILKSQEEQEEYQILSSISSYIGLYIKEMKVNMEVMAEYDFAFAKGKYSNLIRGRSPKINDRDYINIIEGKHPLLGSEAIPLNFEIGNNYRTLVITGPNTGGKTVGLKTIGLLTLMVQSGIHIPVKEGSDIAIFERVLVDIGDSQSIEHSLSTFSGHMKNIIEIINKASYSTLILVDEVGTGTDPLEGAALAVAILDELYRCGAITVATTHYGEIKNYADQHHGFENGCMEFDPETLGPLYTLSIGKAGKSNALWISERLGLRDRVLKKAKKYIDSKSQNISNITFDIEDSIIKKKPLKKSSPIVPKEEVNSSYQVGDCIVLNESGEKAIVYEVEDEYGNLVVKHKGSFITVNRKRVKMFIERESLYPTDYDLDIVFKHWKERKLEHDVKRGALKKKDMDIRLKELEEINK